MSWFVLLREKVGTRQVTMKESSGRVTFSFLSGSLGWAVALRFATQRLGSAGLDRCHSTCI
eukprot:6111854-Amphidinium_carterae.1